ncbi:MAG: GNAT family N-acetyltransferase [Pseudorhodoplanes sp.]|nr:GNAT family N-acetyltransferase [Pseudorhodoplanes sp.]
MNLTLRPYRADDEPAAIDLWQRAWQVAYPQIAFARRVEWWRGRWRDDLVPVAAIVVAERDGAMTGFVTIDRTSGYLDQLAVAPDQWNRGIARALLDEAKRLSPRGIELHVNQDNARAIRLYERSGFAIAGEDVNPHSGAPVFLMRWRGATDPGA